MCSMVRSFDQAVEYYQYWISLIPISVAVPALIFAGLVAK